MLSINPLGAFITDLAVVESRFTINQGDWSGEIERDISFKNRLISLSKSGNYLVAAIESTVTVNATIASVDEALFSCDITVGCTAASPATGDEDNAKQQLLSYGVLANEGFARTLIFQQSQMSQMPMPLIIPPMSFDGIFD